MHVTGDKGARVAISAYAESVGPGVNLDNLVRQIEHVLLGVGSGITVELTAIALPHPPDPIKLRKYSWEAAVGER